jgi:hypothetical protein
MGLGDERALEIKLYFKDENEYPSKVDEVLFNIDKHSKTNKSLY